MAHSFTSATSRCATVRRKFMAALAAGHPADPATYYFRGATFFETGAAGYAWIGKHIVVSSGERQPNGVKLRFYQLL